VTLVSPNRRYPLELDQTEVERYRTMAEAARQAEADLWVRAGIGPGAQVADVGCGPGALLPALAAAVGPDGRVTAVDADPEAVAAATALVAAADLGNVAVREGRADATGLVAGSLDVVMLRHVLAHNGGAEDVIVAHLATLLRPGGCLYLVDADGTAIRVIPEAEHPDLVELQERYLAFRASRGDDNAAGLRLAERVVRAGLELVEFRGRSVIRGGHPGCGRRRGQPGRRWSQLAWRPPRISGVGTRPSRQRRGDRRPSSPRCSPPSAAVRPFDRPISTCAPEEEPEADSANLDAPGLPGSPHRRRQPRHRCVRGARVASPHRSDQSVHAHYGPHERGGPLARTI
jgi:SAM-dependent methyltransferase